MTAQPAPLEPDGGSGELPRKVMQAIARVKDIPEEDITVESTFEGLHVDSLDAIEILFDLEEELDLTVPTERLRELRNVKDVVVRIEMLLADKEPGDGVAADPPEAPHDRFAGSKGGDIEDAPDTRA